MSGSSIPRLRRSTSSTPVIDNGIAHSTGTPKRNGLLPVIDNGIAHSTGTPKRNGLLHYRHRVEQDGDTLTPNVNEATPQADASFRNIEQVSPMLTKLRMTPGRLLKEKQTILVRKHEESRRKVDSLNVGGGVSLWPEMVKMRLTGQDVTNLTIGCTILCIIVTAGFYLLHGTSIWQLLEFRRQLSKFSRNHPIVFEDQASFEESVIIWHKHYRAIVDAVHGSFDVSRVPASYMIYILIYTFTICVLLYYLIDNMFAKSKLSPPRIKRWVMLLSLTSTWTTLMIMTLTLALQTEATIENNIHLLSDNMADLVSTNLSCDRYLMVLQYWRTRCLPPTTHGTITIFGVLPVRDVTYYLTYYSIPIVTVLIAPVFKVIVSVMTIYNIGSQTNLS